MKTWEEATKLNRTDILMLVFYIMNGICRHNCINNK